jgi:hypothetical protein
MLETIFSQAMVGRMAMVILIVFARVRGLGY